MLKVELFLESLPPSLLQINVINGTQWLNLGGQLNDFELVVGKPPETSSDLTLTDVLQRMTNVRRYFAW